MTKELDNFFKRLSETDSRLLLLDYDGTLAPFRKQRDKAFPYAGIEERLDSIIFSGKTTVVIISGRAIEDLKPLLRIKKFPEIWGNHGWERLSADGQYSILKRDKRSIKGLEIARNFICDNGLEEFLEVKPASIAIHYRGVEQKKVLELEKKILYNWEQVAEEFRLEYFMFDEGVELRIPEINKGEAIKSVFARFPSHTVGAYLGDDLTDEDAFKALPDSALGVLVRRESRESAADTRIKPPEELLAFLDKWISIG